MTPKRIVDTLLSRTMPRDDVLALDFFVAGVPPRGYFDLELQKLSKLVRSSKDLPGGGLNQAAEVCLIGLASYFEAFCKNEFAAIINICPQTLNNFVAKRGNATIRLKDVLTVLNDVGRKLGNLLAEEYDFGSAKSINGQFQDLLRITPFSSKESAKYAEFLNDRNLLVHHGGVYTFKYGAQRFTTRRAEGLPHWDSLVVGKRDFQRWSSFIRRMADKMASTSHRALQEFIDREGIRLGHEQKKAIRMLS